MNDTLKKEYAEYVAKHEALRKGSYFYHWGHKETTGFLEPSSFSDLIAGIDFGEITQKDCYVDRHGRINRPLGERFIAHDIKVPTITYGMQIDDRGIAQPENYFKILAPNTYLSLSGDRSQTDKRNLGTVDLSISQVYPEGVYIFDISFWYGEFRFNKFRFYSNNEFLSEAERFNYSLEDIKRRFASGIGYSNVKPTEKWVGGDDNRGHPLTSDYSIDISCEDIYMLANMLFKEGLRDVFKSHKIEIPEAYRNYYQEQALDNDTLPVIHIEEEPTNDKKDIVEESAIDYSIVSDEALISQIKILQEQTLLLEKLSMYTPLSDLQTTTLRLNKQYIEALNQQLSENQENSFSR